MSFLGRLSHNLWIKLLSLVLAMLMSVYVVKVVDPNFTQHLTLPLEVRNVDDNLIIANPRDIPDAVRIKVAGKYSSVRQMSGHETMYIDCSGYSAAGVYTLAVQPPELNDIQVTNQEISQVQIRLEIKVTVEKPVGIDRHGEINQNYEIRDERLSQESVEIIGPKPIVERIAVVQVEPNVDGLDEDFRRQMLPVRLYDENDFNISNPAIELRPAQVRYTIRLVPIASIKPLKVYPEITGQLPEDLLLDRLVANPQTIAVDAGLVSKDLFKDLFYVTTEPIDLTGVTETFTTQAKLIYPFEIPANVHLPETCEVTVQIISIEQAGAVRVPVQQLDKASGFTCQIIPPEVVVFSELILSLDAMEIAKISASISFEGLGAGEYRMVPQVNLPDALKQVKIAPESVQVTIIPSGE
jgi:YbbR domain-containing protein